MHVHVIVRAAGERTADYCCAELARQTSADSVDRVELTPFWRTLREGLERGLRSGAPWVMTCDADVIPAGDAVERVLTWGNNAAADVGVVSGMIQDKFLGGVRFGGIRLYRADVIPEVLDVMPPMGENVRPESSAISRLLERGWQHETLPELTGLHDYEQYYRDIYRKAFLHMQKHVTKAWQFLEIWKSGAAHDDDFRAALAGAANALLWTGDVDCDASHVAYEGTEALARLKLTEKPILVFDDEKYQEEVARTRDALDSGLIIPVSPAQQEIYDKTLPEEESLRRIQRIGNHLKLLSGVSSRAQAELVHQVRRAFPDKAILDSFSVSELARYAIARLGRSFKK